MFFAYHPGLIDLVARGCNASCQVRGGNANASAIRECLAKQNTEPTNRSNDQVGNAGFNSGFSGIPDQEAQYHAPKLRLDYILVNSEFAEEISGLADSSSSKHMCANPGLVEARPMKQAHANMLSDHFPVLAPIFREERACDIISL